MKHQESQLQQSMVRWFAYQYPNLSTLFYHIPNGGKRSSREAARFKKEGVKAGVSDLFLSVPNNDYHGFYFEVKAPKGKLTKNQTDFIIEARKQGYRCEIVRSLEEFTEAVNDYLKLDK